MCCATACYLAAFSKDGEHDNGGDLLLVDDSPQVGAVFLQRVVHQDVFLSPLVALRAGWCAQKTVIQAGGRGV